MIIYDLYGTQDNIESVRKQLERVLNAQFAAHESLYRGDYYRVQLDQGEELILQGNYDPIDREPIEEYANIDVVLYVEGTKRAEELQQRFHKAVPSLVLLHRNKR